MKIIDVLVKITYPVSLFAACSAMLASFFVMFFYDSFWISHCVIFFFILLLTVLGYLVQAAYAKIFGISKNKYTALYEQTETWFVKSIGSSIIVVIASFVFGASYHPCVKYLHAQGYISEYQFEKSTPIFFGFMAFVCLMLGIFLWHNRIERYASIQYSIAGIFVIAVSYPLTAVWLSGVSTGGFHTLMLVIFLISAGIVMTNTALADMRKGRYDLISPEVITHSVRYTFTMFVLLTVSTAVLVFVMFIFLNGAYMILRMVIYTKTGQEWEFFMTEVFGRHGYVRNINIMSFWFVTAGAVLSVAAVILAKNGKTSRYLARILQSVIMFLSRFFDGLELLLKSGDGKRKTYYPYTESERKIQTAPVAEYYFKTKPPYSYMDFIRHLSGIAGIDSKIGYAYRVLCDLYKKNQIAVKISDTPREVRVKASRSFAADSTDRVTYIIEKVKFMPPDFSGNEKEVLLSEICAEVKKYF